MSIDIFSIIGLRNISDWLSDWISRYERGITNLVANGHVDFIAQYRLRENAPVKAGCIGYTSQSYLTRKNKEGEKRPTKAFENILGEFNNEFFANLGKFLPPGLEKQKVILGEIPNMFSLAPLSQKNSAPIRDLKAADGIFGAHYSQAKLYSALFDNIAEKLITNTGVQP